MHRSSRILSLLIPIFLIVASALLLVTAALPFEILRHAGDALARDGSFTSLTQQRLDSLRMPMLLFGIAALMLGLAAIWFRVVLERAIEDGINRGWSQVVLLAEEAGTLAADVRLAWPGRKELAGPVLLIAMGAVFRGLILNRPIEFDEAYTFVEFARHSFLQIFTDYNVPNNHILHTLLVRVAYLTLGDSPWALRLPVFVASLLLLVCAYFVGRAFYNPAAGLLTVAMLACLPVMVVRSASARGYVIVALFMLLGWLCAGYVVRTNNRAAWFLLALFSALGFYTVPVMIFPDGLIFLWLLTMGITRRYGSAYSMPADFFTRLVLTGLLTIVLTGLLYSPILLTAPPAELLRHNQVLHPLSWTHFAKTLPDLWQSILADWGLLFFQPLAWIGCAGLLLSFLTSDRRSSRLPTQLLFILYLGVAVPILRPSPIERLWLWVVPLLCLWSAAGLSWGLEMLSERIGRPGLARRLLGGLLVAILANGTWAAYVLATTDLIVSDPDVETVTVDLKALITTRDIVVVSPCSSVRYWYYFVYHDLPEETIRGIRHRPFERAFVVVYTGPRIHACGGEVFQDVLSHYGPDEDLLNMGSARKVLQVGGAKVLQVDADAASIEKAFPGP